MTRTVFLLVAGFTVCACGGGDNMPDTSANSPVGGAAVSDVDKALAVQRGIDAAPDKADSVLAANGLTSAGFDSLMYGIAADSAKRVAFSAGR